MSDAALIAVVVGGLAAVLIIILLVRCLHKKLKDKKDKESDLEKGRPRSSTLGLEKRYEKPTERLLRESCEQSLDDVHRPCLSLVIPEEGTDDEEAEEKEPLADKTDAADSSIPDSGFEIVEAATGFSALSSSPPSSSGGGFKFTHLEFSFSRIRHNSAEIDSKEEPQSPTQTKTASTGPSVGRRRHHTFCSSDLERPKRREQMIQARQNSKEKALFQRQDSSRGRPVLGRQRSYEHPVPGRQLSCEEPRSPFHGPRGPRLLDNWSPTFLGVASDGRIRSFSFTSSRESTRPVPKKPQQTYKSIDMFRG